MKLTALLNLKGLFSSNGSASITQSDPEPREYSPSKIASLRLEIAANNEAAAEEAASRGYKRNPRIVAASIT